MINDQTYLVNELFETQRGMTLQGVHEFWGYDYREAYCWFQSGSVEVKYSLVFNNVLLPSGLL